MLRGSQMSFARIYCDEVQRICDRIDVDLIDRLALELAALRRRGGRLFFIGVGGSASNCSHAVNDFRKLCRIEAYSPVDNVSELTARINDEGWETVFANWLEGSRASERDAVFVLSVGGGDSERNISVNIVRALDKAKELRLTIFGIIGRESGYTKLVGDTVIVIPTVEPKRVTPHTEAFQAVVWHCLVSHPALQLVGTKWESTTEAIDSVAPTKP